MSADHAAFADRRAAGRSLAVELAHFVILPPCVLALSSNALPVAFEVARELSGRLGLIGSGDPSSAWRTAPPDDDETVIVVDDGAADPATIHDVVAGLRRTGPKTLIYATPIASDEAIATAALYSNLLICLRKPRPFRDARTYYGEFHPVEPGEVRRLLREACDPHAAPGPPLEATTLHGPVEPRQAL
ncbi:hypothetical protein [Sphingomonas sp. MMS24-J13]|uniref:hypothetical protein n=1 Tax=Sphingomonas sp. MMS24-J13 TaxID=3238686 RepID=UPI00384FA912